MSANRPKGLTVFIIILILAAILAGISLYMYNSFLNSPVSHVSRDVEFKVYKGTNSAAIVENLYKKGLIKNRFFARIYLKSKKLDTHLKVGIYKFNTSMTPVQIFEKLLKGELDPDVVTVTIPEGFNIKQIAERLFKAGVIKNVDEFIKETNTGEFEYEFLKDIPKNRPQRLEGYLFPATYELRKTMSNHDIIKIMLDRFSIVYTNTIVGNIKNEKMTPDRILILASMIEKEAVIDEERALISAVFYNRLKKNMMLKSDPTVEYALGVKRETVTFKDLEVESPYNTYKNYGLPIGPICSPGQKSIEAALNPADVDYLFFAAKDDKSHFFTNSDKEFMKFLKSRRVKK